MGLTWDELDLGTFSSRGFAVVRAEDSARLPENYQADHQRCPRRACFPDLGHYRRANGAEENVLRLQDRSDGALEFDMTKLSKES